VAIPVAQIGRELPDAAVPSFDDGGYETQNGTSFACAAVAALAARYQQMTGRRGAALRELLMRTAVEGQAHHDPHAESAPPEGPRPPLSATPGKDILVFQFKDGPSLALHPEGARELIESAAGPQKVDLVSAARPDPAPDLVGTAAAQALDALVKPGIYGLLADQWPWLLGSGLALPWMNAPAPGVPVLVLLHGAFASSAQTFGRLWERHPRRVAELFDAYRGQVYALEQASLSRSVAQLAHDLAQVLPPGATLHLAGHGRGALVAEVIAVLAGDSGMEVVLPASPEGRLLATESLYPTQELLHRKQVRVARVVRVAGPLRGQRLLGERLDAHLSLVKWALEAAGQTVAPAFTDFLMEVARRRGEASQLPGLADMAPDALLLRWLNGITTALPGDLRVIAGRSDEAAMDWWRVLLPDAGQDDGADPLVSVYSSLGGPSRAGGRLVFCSEGAQVHHFDYFAQEESARAFVAALLHEQPQGFVTSPDTR
jgi:pimeloyl-ACP methyl ester carboxylesterase